jgi:hypothetical protein
MCTSIITESSCRICFRLQIVLEWNLKATTGIQLLPAATDTQRSISTLITATYVKFSINFYQFNLKPYDTFFSWISSMTQIETLHPILPTLIKWNKRLNNKSTTCTTNLWLLLTLASSICAISLVFFAVLLLSDQISSPIRGSWGTAGPTADLVNGRKSGNTTDLCPPCMCHPADLFTLCACPCHLQAYHICQARGYAMDCGYGMNSSLQYV